MGVALLALRLLLAVVFLVAGVAKLADLAGSRRAAADFGVPERLAGTVGLLLPLAELAVAVALVVSAAARFGTLAALILLLAFVAAIALALARGTEADCHCFGQLHSAPVSWRTAARNVVLAAMAGFVVVEGWHSAGVSATGWVARLDATAALAIAGGAMLLLVIGFLGWFALQILHQNGRLLARLEAIEASLGGPGLQAGAGAAQANGHRDLPPAGLPVGSPAPPFSLPDLDGEPVMLADLTSAGVPVLLVFSDPGCGPCNALLPELGRWRSEHAGRTTLALISRGSAEQNRSKSGEHDLEHVLLQEDDEVAKSYECYGTPGAVLVAPDGSIASPLAQGAEQIQTILAGAGGHLNVIHAGGNGNGNGHAPPQAEPNPMHGQPAPELALADLDGNEVALADLLGRPTLLLFWNPQCGFCQQMLDDLTAFEAKPPPGAPSWVVISTGTVEDNRAQGFRSPVLLDQDFGAGSAFGASGTPMAVLIDADRRVASHVAAGAQSVLALAGTSVARDEGAATPTGRGR